MSNFHKQLSNSSESRNVMIVIVILSWACWNLYTQKLIFFVGLSLFWSNVNMALINPPKIKYANSGKY